MRRLRRRRRSRGSERADFLMVGLGNPGRRYAGTRHNIGFEVIGELAARWDAPRARERYQALVTCVQAGPQGTRVALLEPQTFMNEVGPSVAAARGEMHVALDRVIVCHDHIDLPFGEIRSGLGGGAGGHNGLKSLSASLGGPDYWRVKVGVGRPDSTDPEVVSAWVLSRFSESATEVASLVAAAADECQELITRLSGAAS